jgi:hypothetical protein
MIDFVIPGMVLTRQDIGVLVYKMKRGLSDEEASSKARALTDNQMHHIADQFSDYFFYNNEDLFRQILSDAVDEIEDYEREEDE